MLNVLDEAWDILAADSPGLIYRNFLLGSVLVQGQSTFSSWHLAPRHLKLSNAEAAFICVHWAGRGQVQGEAASHPPVHAVSNCN